MSTAKRSLLVTALAAYLNEGLSIVNFHCKNYSKGGISDIVNNNKTEIKCPFSISNQSPLEVNIPYLRNGATFLFTLVMDFTWKESCLKMTGGRSLLKLLMCFLFANYLAPEVLSMKASCLVAPSLSAEELSKDHFKPYPPPFCALCNNHNNDSSIQCTICSRWFHWGCAGVDSVHGEWFCITCECNV